MSRRSQNTTMPTFSSLTHPSACAEPYDSGGHLASRYQSSKGGGQEASRGNPQHFAGIRTHVLIEEGSILSCLQEAVQKDNTDLVEPIQANLVALQGFLGIGITDFGHCRITAPIAGICARGLRQRRIRQDLRRSDLRYLRDRAPHRALPESILGI